MRGLNGLAAACAKAHPTVAKVHPTVAKVHPTVVVEFNLNCRKKGTGTTCLRQNVASPPFSKFFNPRNPRNRRLNSFFRDWLDG